MSQNISKDILGKDSAINNTKVLCLILAEHEKLCIENPLLLQKISLLEEINRNSEISDSLLKVEVEKCKNKIIEDSKELNSLKKYKKNSLKGFISGGIILFILGLIL